MIGIDRYRRWNHLSNAVGDARGVLEAFKDLGFVSITAPLLDDAATGDEIRRLPSNLKAQLEINDSLVVFFAGHGHTTSEEISDGLRAPKGYLIPVDADRPDGQDHTWQDIEAWLRGIAGLRARHILVILDSCHSGIALSRSIQYRGVGVRSDGLAVPVHQRCSRRVFTSALDDQKAMDGGPLVGHSVFTGYLIEALRRAGKGQAESSVVGVSDVADEVRRRVVQYSAFKQLPCLGWLEYDDFGELLLSRGQPRIDSASPQTATRGASRGQAILPDENGPTPGSRIRRRSSKANGSRSRVSELQSAAAGGRADEARTPRSTDGGLPDRTEGWVLDREVGRRFDHQGEERRRGAVVLTVVAGEAMAAQTAWGTWAARHGYLTLATQAMSLEAAVADLLAQTPWLRCVPEARKRLAAAARLDVEAVDAALDARAGSGRRQWIEDVAVGDPHVRVSGWLLSWLRRASACAPDPATAPVRPEQLLAIACDLALPTAVLLFHPEPDERWLERAVVTAAQLIEYLPEHSVAVTAPEELVTRVLARRRHGAAWTMARQGLVKVEALAVRAPGRARHGTMRVLFEALVRDPRTRGRFVLDGEVASPDGPAIDVALVAHAERIAVELDAWYHFHDPEGYRRDRVQDRRLSRAGYFVLRFPAEDVDDRLASTIEHLAIALAGRRAARALL